MPTYEIIFRNGLREPEIVYADGVAVQRSVFYAIHLRRDPVRDRRPQVRTS
jgi:hypothetical protein